MWTKRIARSSSRSVFFHGCLAALTPIQDFLDHAQCPVDQQRICQFTGCGKPFIPGLFSVHLHQYHGIVLSDELKVRCDWGQCGAEMNIESIDRHVAESHCGIFEVCLFFMDVEQR